MRTRNEIIAEMVESSKAASELLEVLPKDEGSDLFKEITGYINEHLMRANTLLWVLNSGNKISSQSNGLDSL